MKLTVTHRGLHLAGGEARVGQTIEIKGDKIPSLYLGKVRPADQSLEVATPSITDDERAELEELRKFKADAESKEEVERKAFLLDEIEKAAGKRPGGNTKLETLESQYAELNQPKE